MKQPGETRTTRVRVAVVEMEGSVRSISDALNRLLSGPPMCPIAEQMLGKHEGHVELPDEPLNRKLSGRLKARS